MQQSLLSYVSRDCLEAIFRDYIATVYSMVAAEIVGRLSGLTKLFGEDYDKGGSYFIGLWCI